RGLRHRLVRDRRVRRHRRDHPAPRPHGGAVSELITASEAAALLGVASGRVARQTLARWGVRPTGRAPGRGGESLYPRDVVVDALRRRPGQGARTDLATRD